MQLKDRSFHVMVTCIFHRTKRVHYTTINLTVIHKLKTELVSKINRCNMPFYEVLELGSPLRAADSLQVALLFTFLTALSKLSLMVKVCAFALLFFKW